MSNFVYTLNELMVEHDLNQSKLSEKLNIDSSTISKYLCSNQSPEIDIAIRIANYFDCTLDFLFGLSEENKKKVFYPCPPFSARFQFLLDYSKKSRYELQKNTGISKSTMYYWQIGKSKPTIENIITLSKYLKYSMDFVVGRINFE